jgi:hypothetical protein
VANARRALFSRLPGTHRLLDVREDRLLKDVVADLAVDRGERVIEDKQRGVAVQRACDSQPALLAAGQRRAALADLRLDALRQQREVRLQPGATQNVLQAGIIHLPPEQKVLFDRAAHEERLLRRVADAAHGAHARGRSEARA